MASPAVAINGTTANSLTDPEASTSIAQSTKRKRDGTDDGASHGSDAAAPSATSSAGDRQDVKTGGTHDGKGLRQKSARDAAVIRDYFRVIQK
jgi:hypothetical protein